MCSPIETDQASAGSCRYLSWPGHYGGLSMLVVMAVLFGRPDLAFAQYPGFSITAKTWILCKGKIRPDKQNRHDNQHRQAALMPWP